MVDGVLSIAARHTRLPTVGLSSRTASSTCYAAVTLHDVAGGRGQEYKR